jgi:hypothetical protein
MGVDVNIEGADVDLELAHLRQPYEPAGTMTSYSPLTSPLNTLLDVNTTFTVPRPSTTFPERTHTTESPFSISRLFSSFDMAVLNLDASTQVR